MTANTRTSTLASCRIALLRGNTACTLAAPQHTHAPRGPRKPSPGEPNFFQRTKIYASLSVVSRQVPVKTPTRPRVPHPVRLKPDAGTGPPKGGLYGQKSHRAANFTNRGWMTDVAFRQATP